jgi:hypothetical protein
MGKIQTGSHLFGACAAIALAIGLFAGCSNPVTHPASGVLVRLGGVSGARTLLPAWDEFYYTLTFTKGAGADAVTVDTILTPGSGLAITVALDEGMWNLFVKGYLTQADAESDLPGTHAISGGATNILVYPGQTTPVPVTLFPHQTTGETGTLNYTVSFPNSPAVSAATLSYVKFGASDAPVTVDLLQNTAPNTITGTDGSDSTASGAIILVVGYYRISISLNNGKIVEEGDIAHIYNGLPTPAVFTYSAASFAERPDPTDLQALIDTANAAKTGVYPSADGAGISIDSYWVTQAQLDAFTAAITTARTVADTPESQAALDAAETALQAAITAFNGQKTAGAYNSAGDTALGLYVGASLTPVSGTETLALSLAWLKANAGGSTEYTILIGADESLPPWTLGGTAAGNTTAADNKTGVKLTLKGKGMERTVLLSVYGTLFTVKTGVTLVLDTNISLKGRNPNSNTNPTPLVSVASALEMKDGAKISGNKGTADPGGAVYVDADGTFTMSGGEISDNSTRYGGGVYVGGGTFTMSGGKVSGNSTTNGGGGVYTEASGTFTMSGGEISGNTTAGELGGGGVYVADGIFTKTGGGVIRGDADMVHSPGETANTATHIQAKGHAISGAEQGFRQADVDSTQDVSIDKSGGTPVYSPVLTDPFWDRPEGL